MNTNPNFFANHNPGFTPFNIGIVIGFRVLQELILLEQKAGFKFSEKDPDQLVVFGDSPDALLPHPELSFVSHVLLEIGNRVTQVRGGRLNITPTTLTYGQLVKVIDYLVSCWELAMAFDKPQLTAQLSQITVYISDLTFKGTKEEQKAVSEALANRNKSMTQIVSGTGARTKAKKPRAVSLDKMIEHGAV